MRVDEVVRLKLGGGDNSRAQAFMQDLEGLSDDHPFHPRQRIIGGATVEVSSLPGRNRVHLHDVLSLEPDKGHATRAIGLLQKLAAKHDVTIELFAKAYAKDKRYVTDTETLVKWYQKLGFTIMDEPDEIDIDNGVEMLYIPS